MFYKMSWIQEWGEEISQDTLSEFLSSDLHIMIDYYIYYYTQNPECSHHSISELHTNAFRLQNGHRTLLEKRVSGVTFGGGGRVSVIWFNKKRRAQCAAGFVMSWMERRRISEGVELL